MSRVIVITSGKGGVGKSTLTLAVGKELVRLGSRVALLDTDIGLNNLDVLMNVEKLVTYDLIDVINNRCRIKQALLEDKTEKGLYLMPSSHAYTKDLDGQSIREICGRLKPLFDYVLIDCPAGIEKGFHRSVQAADEAIVVSTPHLSALKDASKVAGLIRSYKLPVSLAINRVRGDLIIDGESLTIDDIGEKMNVDIIGVIPEDDCINLISAGCNKIKHGYGNLAIKVLAKNIHYGTKQIFDATKRYRGLFGGIKRKLKEIL